MKYIEVHKLAMAILEGLGVSHVGVSKIEFSLDLNRNEPVLLTVERILAWERDGDDAVPMVTKAIHTYFRPDEAKPNAV